MTPDKHRPRLWEIYMMSFAPFSATTQVTHNDFEDVNPDIR
jgi:hypothetical protein